MKIKKILVALIVMSLMAGPAFAKNSNSSGKNKTLPPGLQKKSEQGKPLPPGWQKNMSKGDILDESIYTRGRVVVPLGKDGSISVEIEGSLFKLHEKTREIIEILI